MSDKGQSPDEFISTGVGADTNEPITEPHRDRPEQTPDQFFDPAREREKADERVPAGHATKGMTSLGWSEASRIENSAELQERDRKQFERAAAKALASAEKKDKDD